MSDDYDKPVIFQQFLRTARKEHKCYECGSKINTGKQYLKTQGLWNGEWENFKTCMDCRELMFELMEYDVEFAFGNVKEAFEEMQNP